MINYIVESGLTISPPDGLGLNVQKVDVHSNATAEITAGTDTYYFDGLNENLNLLFTTSIDISVTSSGYANIGVTYIGDQASDSVFDLNKKPVSAGRYPGRWGNSIGSRY